MIRAAAIVLAGLALTACGLTAPRSGPGFADLESPGVWDTDRQMALSIGPTLLRFAARHVEDDPEMRELLRSLDGVRIRIYEIDGDASRVAARIDGMQARLEDDGWVPLMLVRQNSERTQLMLKSSRGVNHGLTLISSDGQSEAVVINLIGEIQPRMFSEVMVALDIEEGGAQGVEIAMMEPCGKNCSDNSSSSRRSASAAHPASRRNRTSVSMDTHSQ